jgi:hypothetical protein
MGRLPFEASSKGFGYHQNNQSKMKWPKIVEQLLCKCKVLSSNSSPIPQFFFFFYLEKRIGEAKAY